MITRNIYSPNAPYLSQDQTIYPVIVKPKVYQSLTTLEGMVCDKIIWNVQLEMFVFTHRNLICTILEISTQF